MKSKHTLKIILSFLFFAQLFFSHSARAQQNCVLVNSLNINTGTDNAGNLVTIGQNDPNWIVTAVSPALQPIAGVVTPPANAISITPAVPWAFNAGARWISCLPANNYSTPQTNNVYSMTVTRTFRTCVADTYTFSLNAAADNFITSVSVDGGPSVFAHANITNHATYAPIPPFNATLAPGLHTLSITVQNYTVAQAENTNWFGLSLIGTINGTLNSIAGPFCANTCPPPNCSDTCYWKVTGNNIINGNNILGTLTGHDIRLFSSNTQRGVIQAGGNFGWKTNNPTTLFHINCAGPIGAPSNLRFENLTRGSGDPLVIDANGYVFRGSRFVVDEKLAQRVEELAEENKKLAADVIKLRNEINTLLGKNSPITGMGNGTNALSQNRPNPFNGSTTIDYEIHQYKNSAFIMVCDLTGKELVRYRIGSAGKGNVQVDRNTLSSGIYVYSLVVDGTEIDSRKMTIIKP